MKIYILILLVIFLSSCSLKNRYNNIIKEKNSTWFNNIHKAIWPAGWWGWVNF